MIEDTPATRPHLIEVLSTITATLTDTNTDSADTLAQITTASADLLGADAAGIMVLDPRGGVAVLAASDERARIVELLQTQTERGPCLDCIATGAPVAVPDLPAADHRWPEFTEVATDVGYRAVLAIPMILDGHPVGGLNVLYTTTREFTDQDRRLATVLAGQAVLHLIRDDTAHRRAALTAHTLDLVQDRVHVEHAVGLVAGTLHRSPHQARILLEQHAHTHRIPLRALAHQITTGALPPTHLTDTDQG